MVEIISPRRRNRNESLSQPGQSATIIRMIELTAENAPAYLAERGWSAGGFCQVEPLSGGVSNVVFRVKTFKGWSVLKQSRSQLRTADPWFSDLSRIFRE